MDKFWPSGWVVLPMKRLDLPEKSLTPLSEGSERSGMIVSQRTEAF